MTLGTLLKQGREILQNAGIAEWDLDAWYLLEYVTGVSRILAPIQNQKEEKDETGYKISADSDMSRRFIGDVRNRNYGCGQSVLFR